MNRTPYHCKRAVLMLGLMAGMAQAAPPPNPTVSDNFNTAGGTGALQNTTTGSNNTGFGFFFPGGEYRGQF